MMSQIQKQLVIFDGEQCSIMQGTRPVPHTDHPGRIEDCFKISIAGTTLELGSGEYLLLSKTLRLFNKIVLED